MNKHIVATLAGPDHVGIVDRVTKKILELGGNIEESRMARLGGDFAMLLFISISAENRESLSASLERFNKDGFQIFLRETEGEAKTKYTGWLPYLVEVSGADHEGIINSITHNLANNGINIESMDTNTAPAPMSGTILFTMTAIVVAPPDLKYHKWRDPLDDICNAVNVNIKVSPYRG
ncbi:MAG: transcriptional regulator [Deltaproteobacteria bacterium]|nr:transcriptional regulator [Deltaproteobacteria bacterium]